MPAISDPSELLAPDLYKQARFVASRTSRSTDVNWYKAPEELSWQWHLWFDGAKDVVSAVFDRSSRSWSIGPPLSLVALTTGEDLDDTLDDLLSTSFFQEKPEAIGVILHVADEFSLAELAPRGDLFKDEGVDLQMLRYDLIDNPREVLADGDVSLESNTWRLLPFWGARSGNDRCIAVTLSRSREDFLKMLIAAGEARGVPIRVSVCCAPVEAFAAIPWLKPDIHSGCLVAVCYYKFTAVFAVSDVGEMSTVRGFVHRAGLPFPTGFGDLLWNMSLGAEMATLRVLVLSAQKDVLLSVAQELELYSASRNPVLFELLSLDQHPLLGAIPGHRPEFLIFDKVEVEKLVDSGPPMIRTESFRQLLRGWARQNFMDTARLDQMYPTQGDLRLLRLSKWFTLLLLISVIATGAYGVFSLVEAMGRPSWELTNDQVKQTEGKHKKLLEEKRQMDATDSLFKPRSRGWVTVEVLLQLFPEDSGVRLESFTYSAEAARKKLAASKSLTGENVGINRTWKLKGFGKSQAIQSLNNLNSQQGLNEFFNRVAMHSGDEALRPEATRQMTIALTQARNAKFNSQASPGDLARDPSLAFPFSFEVSITQSIVDTDGFALPLDNPLK